MECFGLEWYEDGNSTAVWNSSSSPSFVIVSNPDDKIHCMLVIYKGWTRLIIACCSLLGSLNQLSFLHSCFYFVTLSLKSFSSRSNLTQEAGKARHSWQSNTLYPLPPTSIKYHLSTVLHNSHSSRSLSLFSKSFTHSILRSLWCSFHYSRFVEYMSCMHVSVDVVCAS